MPPLGEIEANYPTGVRDRLARLARPEFRPGEGGQLILWHGPPGTGKTYALRALGWEWREWCELHYVIDPEVFIGQRADYMIDVLLDDDEPLPNRGAAADIRPKWRSTRPRPPPGLPRAGSAVRAAALSPSRTCSHMFTATRGSRSVPWGSGREAWPRSARLVLAP